MINAITFWGRLLFSPPFIPSSCVPTHTSRVSFCFYIYICIRMFSSYTKCSNGELLSKKQCWCACVLSTSKVPKSDLRRPSSPILFSLQVLLFILFRGHPVSLRRYDANQLFAQHAAYYTQVNRHSLLATHVSPFIKFTKRMPYDWAQAQEFNHTSKKLPGIF